MVQEPEGRAKQWSHRCRHPPRLSLGNPGDAKALREGVSELRVDSGPGYRVYFTKRGALVVLLLCGGDKGTQDKDIERAINIAKEWTLWR